MNSLKTTAAKIFSIGLMLTVFFSSNALPGELKPHGPRQAARPRVSAEYLLQGHNSSAQLTHAEWRGRPTDFVNTFIVTNINDTGDGSLRWAIDHANNSVGLDQIAFNILGNTEIRPLTPLPIISEAVVIDGTTQTGYAGRPIVCLDGSLAGTGINGLTIWADNCTIRGLDITGWIGTLVLDPDSDIVNGGGIAIFGGNNTIIEGNYIGIDSYGTTRQGNDFGVEIFGNSSGDVIGGLTANAQNRIAGNNYSGIYISPDNTGGNTIEGNQIGVSLYYGSTITYGIGNKQCGIFIEGPGNTIGGTTAEARNIISANWNVGISLDSLATGNVVNGNYIGTDVVGSNALGNGKSGIWVLNASNNDITGNIISGNTGAGIYMEKPGATGNLVVRNNIGTNAAKTALLPNGYGIILDSAHSNTIGNGMSGQQNVISGNTVCGILVCSEGEGNIIRGNIIGTDSARSARWGNGYDGIAIVGSQNIVGGTSVGAGNTIWYNQGAGIYDSSGNGNIFRMNSIYSNGDLGIDLAPPGVNLNSPPGTPGPNKQQNFPELDSIHLSAAYDTIYGRLSSGSNQTYVIDLYSNSRGNPSGYGEGKTWIDSLRVQTDADGNVTFMDVLSPAHIGHVLTATATDQEGNTSEFSLGLPGLSRTILKPLRDSLFVAGKKDTIRWSGPKIDTVDILYTPHSDQPAVKYIPIVTAYTTNTSSFVWDPIPSDVISRKCRIVIRSSKDPDISDTSDNFRIKPYILTRIGSDGNYIVFNPAVDGWGFANSQDNMWPETWWQYFNYTAEDPNTGMLYPAYFYGAPHYANASDFPDWPLFVDAFSKTQCFFPNPGTGSFDYNQWAVEKWGSIKGAWGGSCYGLALTCFLNFDGYIKPPGSPKTLYQLRYANNDIREFINKYFLYQYGLIQQFYWDVAFRKPVTQTLSGLKEMFCTDNRNDQVLSLVFNKGAHSVNPFRLGEGADYDTIFVYDNNYPGNTKFILVNTWGNHAWGYSPDWGVYWSGYQSGYGLSLESPVSDALGYPTLSVPVKAEYAERKRGQVSELSALMVYNSPNASVRIINPAADSMGYDRQSGEWFSSMSSGHPILSESDTAQAPLGYYLPLQTPGETYALTMKGFTDPLVHCAVFTDSTAYSYSRSDGDSTQTDAVSIGNGIHIFNNDQQNKKLFLKAIAPADGDEHSFRISNYTVSPGDSLHLRVDNRTELLLRNFGSPKMYDMDIIHNTPVGGKTYRHKNIQLDNNTSEKIIPSWNGLDTQQVKILIDHGNKGTYDDSAMISFLSTPSTLGQTPYLDLTFGNHGTVDMFLPGDVGEYAYAGAILSDGRILAAGRSWVPNYNSAGVDTGDSWEFTLSRFNADGTLDTMFGQGGVARTRIVGGTFLTDYATAMAIQSDGRIVLAGQSTAGLSATNATTAFALARFNADGSIDQSFGTNGTVRTKIAGGDNYDAASAVIIQPDGKIVAAGTSGTWSFYSQSWSHMQFAIARYNSDGTLDATFGPNGGTVRTPVSGGTGQSDYVYSAARQDDGKIVLAGTSDGFAVARFDTSGNLDAGFGPSGGTLRIITDSMTFAEGRSVMIQPDHKIVIAGTVQTKTSVGEFGAVRLNPDATLDSTFGVSGVADLHASRSTSYYDAGYCALMQPDGKIVVAGQAGDSLQHGSFGLARFTAGGSPDSTFGINGSIVNHIGDVSPVEANSGRWIGIQLDGKLVIVGHSSPKTFYFGTQGITTSDITLARYMPTTSFLVEGIRTPESSIPEGWELNQNYPNPFNPATTIRYELKRESKVHLQVYNILGQVVATLVDGVEQAGSKQVVWNARNAASGVYFYRLDAISVSDKGQEFTSVKKMLLIR
jgi:uncharacterized delta-60 repeat protein